MTRALPFKRTDLYYRKPLGIVDSGNRLFMVFLRRPVGATDWDECVRRASDKMIEAREKGLASGAWTQKDLDHHRGSFLAINSGVSFGGGPTVGVNRLEGFDSC